MPPYATQASSPMLTKTPSRRSPEPHVPLPFIASLFLQTDSLHSEVSGVISPHVVRRPCKRFATAPIDPGPQAVPVRPSTALSAVLCAKSRPTKFDRSTGAHSPILGTE